MCWIRLPLFLTVFWQMRQTYSPEGMRLLWRAMKASASAAAAGNRFERWTKAARRVLVCYTQSLHAREFTAERLCNSSREVTCSTRDWESGQKKELL